MTGKLLTERIVGNGSTRKWGLPHDAYDGDGNPNPRWWFDKLTPERFASGTVIRYGYGVLDDDSDVFSHKHRDPPRHYGYFNNPFDIAYRFNLANGPEWGQRMYEEAHRAALEGTPVYWYHGKPGIGFYDSPALDIYKALPGTHIVDSTNGADGRPSWMPANWWGEAMVSIPLAHLSYTPGGGQYAFGNNALSEGGDFRIKTAVELAKFRNFPTIISCHEPADAEWLLSDAVTKLVNGPPGMESWEVLLKSGISLAFRGDFEKVDAFVGGRLDRMMEVAGE